MHVFCGVAWPTGFSDIPVFCGTLTMDTHIFCDAITNPRTLSDTRVFCGDPIGTRPRHLSADPLRGSPIGDPL